MSLLLTPGWLHADSELIFPRMSLGQNELTGLAIVNPGDEAATVSLTAYGADGQALNAEGFQNPVEVSVGPGQQYANVTSAIFGQAFGDDRPAWIRATSLTNDLSGFFLFLTTTVDVFDGADLPPTSGTVVFNEVRVDQGFQTELNLVNPGSTGTMVTLTLMGMADPVSRQLELPANGVARLDAADFFGLNGAAAQGAQQGGLYIVASAATPIAGFEFVQGSGDLLGLNARPADELLDTMLFPQLAVLGGINSEVVVVNYSDETALVTFLAHRPDGSLYGIEDLQENPVTVSLAGGASVRRDLAELFGFSGSSSLEGWLEVVSSSKAVNGSLSYTIPALNSRASVAGLREPARRALFSHIATDLGFFTGIAMLNGSELTANVKVLALRSDGTRLGVFSTVLLPGQRISRLVNELISEAAGQAGGFIWVSSDNPIYLTSLFGSASSGVLANIPPQPVPDSFRPDIGVPELQLDPLMSILAPTASQQFMLEGTGGSSVWSVNNVVGGSAVLGMVSETGVYIAPAQIPDDLPVTVSAASGESVVGGSVDILSPELFLSSAGTIQSVSYLRSTDRVYFAELAALGGAEDGLPTPTSGRLRPAGTTTSRIMQVVNRNPQPLLQLDGEEVPKIIPFQAVDNREYLLLAAKTSGRILRLDVNSGEAVTIASQLQEPTALVYDNVEGELLVAHGSGVTAVPDAELNLGLAPASAGLPQGPSAGRQDFLDAPRGRVEVNRCNGNVYLSLEQEGQILEYVRETSALRVLADDLDRPGPLLGLYRKGVGCSDAFHLLVPERGAGRILIIVPSLDLIRPWLEVSDVTDLTLILPGSDLAPGGGVLISSSIDGESQIDLVRFPGIYRENATNPPPRPDRSGCVLLQLTQTSEADVTTPRPTADGERVIFVANGDLTGGNPDGSDELFAADHNGQIQQLTNLAMGTISEPVVNADGTRIVFSSNASLTLPDPPGENLFLLDTTTQEILSIPVRPEGPASMDGSGTLLVVSSKSDPLGMNPDGNREIFLFEDGGPNARVVTQLTQTANTASRRPSISRDGQVVVFRSVADFTGENPNNDAALFVLRPATGMFSQVAIEETGPQELALTPIPISDDGGRVVFTSNQNLGGMNPGGQSAVFWANTTTNEIQLVFGQARELLIYDISANGNFATLSSTANPVGKNKDRNVEVFLVNLNTREVSQLTRSRKARNRQAYFSSLDNFVLVTFLSDSDPLEINPEMDDEIFRLRCRK